MPETEKPPAGPVDIYFVICGTDFKNTIGTRIVRIIIITEPVPFRWEENYGLCKRGKLWIM